NYKIKDFFVDNANIELFNGELFYNNFIIKELPSYPGDFSKGYYYTNNDAIIFQPNTYYELKINIDGKIISGSTITPGDFEILTPAPNSIVNIKDLQTENKLLIKWTKSSTAWGYTGKIIKDYLIMLPDTSYYGSRELSFITTDTSFVIENANILSSEGHLEISISAFDENFYHHHIEMYPEAGVEGAYGYLGSSVLKSVNLSIIE
ncbi:MAG: hypothetical protein JW956_13920, partial [Calditrichaceae bacterium]|nr:hypothetical protein [Calditrichaceae bacterium]